MHETECTLTSLFATALTKRTRSSNRLQSTATAKEGGVRGANSFERFRALSCAFSDLDVLVECDDCMYIPRECYPLYIHPYRSRNILYSSTGCNTCNTTNVNGFRRLYFVNFSFSLANSTWTLSL